MPQFKLMVDQLLSLCDGDFNGLIDVITGACYRNEYCTKSDFCILIHKINKRWNIAAQTKKGYNATQCLKQYCRMKYSENKNTMTSPPKNASCKAEFVKWASLNNVSLADFDTPRQDYLIQEITNVNDSTESIDSIESHDSVRGSAMLLASLNGSISPLIPDDSNEGNNKETNSLDRISLKNILN
eukprot:TRINITY_DN2481_c0_g1_i1.p1 TRINITY_DN2481_c0_g1~~TRINITY_DN2481_c0_g1_i1.p1  ORF type:complete len:185 (+),score=32.64 TRINITY_DN2481_c0_g1_i1:172-726(+)